jgi:hypothetical protein
MKTLTQAFREARAQQIALHPDNPGGGQFVFQDKIYSTHQQLGGDPPLDNYTPEPVQSIWFKEEISIAQELEQMIPALTEEFLANTPGFDQCNFAENVDLAPPIFVSMADKIKNAELIDIIKYVYPPVFDNQYPTKHYVYPALAEYLKKLGDHCVICYYAVLKPSIVARRIAIENLENKFLRIYVPLIAPDNSFVEVEGIEINFKDIFAIDNTLLHSEQNLSDKPRLVLVLDVSREYLGLPTGAQYNEERQRHIEPFVRGAQPRMYHTVER